MCKTDLTGEAGWACGTEAEGLEQAALTEPAKSTAQTRTSRYIASVSLPQSAAIGEPGGKNHSL